MIAQTVKEWQKLGVNVIAAGRIRNAIPAIIGIFPWEYRLSNQILLEKYRRGILTFNGVDLDD